MILDGEHDDFGAEKLKGLMKILPEMDEIEMLKSYDGDKTKIGNAERFILQLVDVPKWVHFKYPNNTNINYLDYKCNFKKHFTVGVKNLHCQMVIFFLAIFSLMVEASGLLTHLGQPIRTLQK